MTLETWTTERMGLPPEGGYKSLNQVIITNNDRVQYQYHTDGTIRARKFIRSKNPDFLYAIIKLTIEGHSRHYNAFKRAFLPSTNHRWISTEILEFLYDAEKLDEKDYDFFASYFG